MLVRAYSSGAVVIPSCACPASVSIRASGRTAASASVT